jgi:hypothetical protein
VTTESPQRSVLVIGRSRLVLDGAVAGLRDLGYTAQATNDFSDVTGRFDVRRTDVVVFGGQVPPDRKAELREEIGALNPRVTFVQGLAGIPGLIVDQVRSALSPGFQTPGYHPGERVIRLVLDAPADVKVTVWWQTSFVPPDPKSDSLVLLDEPLPRGGHSVPVPDHIPRRAAFASVRVGPAFSAFGIATDR